MYSQFGGPGGFVASPNDGKVASQGPKGFSTSSTLRCVTVLQIIQAIEAAQDNTFIVDGQPLHNVTICGRLESIAANDASLDLLVQDSSGSIEVKYYLDNQDIVEKANEFQVDTYVRVYGSIRSVGGQCPLVAFNVRNVEFTEVTTHSLSVIYEHLSITKRNQQNIAEGQIGVKMEALPTQFAGTPNKEPKDAVLNVFLSAGSELTADQVVQALGGKFNTAQVQNYISNLADDGALYFTKDGYYQACI